ncbi:hypothetical protein TCAL_02031 [Tigriopus californicus]|uniref:Peptidase S1 domain-containing protein n=1 Tax=Tigriopus californicus TaxID=6832 RepID=A0A553NBV4_TIGCA|nr:uncharacterized protein LOC131889046 [Tigriopus californicus]TRY62920.1 hypothetical protein TCAL_02031 [Tigriopus californicus]|eukprot:TCALIF_02031-PA protein Name:"Similar to TMPRSS3 Transmembrane protease serine 3 (Homo sapiens)" AED:0.01 eAED:0.01 QI:84/1/1/1/0.75/0.6/5/11/550
MERFLRNLVLLSLARLLSAFVPTLNQCHQTCGRVQSPHGRPKRFALEDELDLYSYEEDQFPSEAIPRGAEYDPYYDLNGGLSEASNISDSDTRIVNGYDAADRPWLALLSISGASCGGALLNKRYILTAAHCFCRQSGGAICEEQMTDGLPTHQPTYDLTQTVVVFLGINGSPLRTKGRNRDQIYRVISAKIRAGWYFGKTFSPDLALAKLDRDVVFSASVFPICIPIANDFPDISNRDQKLQAFVAGWGAVYSQCDTNDQGPSPHTMCKFPFVYQGMVHHQCAQMPPPSHDNPVCQQFLRWHSRVGSRGRIQMGQEGTFSIFYWDDAAGRAERTTCYMPNDRTSRFGWCGTCYSGNLNPGQEGYCDKFLSGTELNTTTEFSRPQLDQNWGWCNQWCENARGQTNAQRLQETALDILTPEECQTFGASLEVNASSEICTGRKKNFDLVYQFRRVESGRGMKFKEEAKFQNKLGLADDDHDFYLGGTDSCQGDSGGPLIRWERVDGSNLRAYIIGTVSRGIGCGNFNQPGIFTRTTSHLDWLYENIKDGNC